MVQRSVSSFFNLAISAGLPPPGKRCCCWYRVLISGSSSAALTARLSFTATRDLSLQFYEQPFGTHGNYSNWMQLADPRATNWDDRYTSYNGGDPGAQHDPDDEMTVLHDRDDSPHPFLSRQGRGREYDAPTSRLAAARFSLVPARGSLGRPS